MKREIENQESNKTTTARVLPPFEEWKEFDYNRNQNEKEN